MKKWVLLLAFLLSFEVAYACSCIPPEFAYDAMDNSDAVFSGKVTGIDYIGNADEAEPRILVEFEVYEVWKGDLRKKITLDTVYNTYTCNGYFFEDGKEYIVFAHRKEDGSLGTRLCSGTQLLEKASESIKELEEGKPENGLLLEIMQPEKNMLKEEKKNYSALYIVLLVIILFLLNRKLFKFP
jgi:hypothetical protein